MIVRYRDNKQLTFPNLFTRPFPILFLHSLFPLMEAIDDWANENIARSVACNVLDYRKQKEYNAIVPLSSKLLCERIRYLLTSDDQWDTVIQWQEDDCPYVIETAWDTPDELYQNQVYYRRLDRETLQCVVEFCHQSKKHYAVVLMLEEEEELKYHNTRAFSEAEWRSLTDSWSTSLEHAERKFMHHLTHHPQNTDTAFTGKKEPSANKVSVVIFGRKRRGGMLGGAPVERLIRSIRFTFTLLE